MAKSKLKSGGFIIFLSIIISIILMIRPVPNAFEHYRPDWIILVVVYWAIALPHRYNVGQAWISGLVLDLLLGSTLGIQAFSLALVVYLASTYFQLIRNMALWQQAIVIAGLEFTYLLVIYSLENMVGNVQLLGGYYWPVLTTSIIWPWIFLLMRKVRRRFKVK